MIDSKRARRAWKDVQTSTGFKKSLTFFIFVVIAALFWFIMALNDNIQDDFEVKVNINNVPDSVTFITLPPERIHVMVRDKGTNLWRNGILGSASININFKDFSSDGLFRMSKSELNAALKNAFGPSAALLSSSVDSLRLTYTTIPGKRLPVVVSADLSPAVGKIIVGQPKVDPQYVVVYSLRNIIDTLTHVNTEHFSRRNLEESVEVPVRLHAMHNVRIVPTSVNVKIQVEPLVRKQASVTLQVLNVPDGQDLLLFPSNVRLEYYVPMSQFNQNSIDRIDVAVDYRDVPDNTRKLPIHLLHYDPGLQNMRLLNDSVEYTLVRN